MKKMNKEIQIQMRTVFGVDRISPVCHVANALIKFKFPQKTFNVEDLKTMKALGLNVEWKAGKV